MARPTELAVCRKCLRVVGRTGNIQIMTQWKVLADPVNCEHLHVQRIRNVHYLGDRMEVE